MMKNIFLIFFITFLKIQGSIANDEVNCFTRLTQYTNSMNYLAWKSEQFERSLGSNIEFNDIVTLLKGNILETLTELPPALLSLAKKINQTTAGGDIEYGAWAFGVGKKYVVGDLATSNLPRRIERGATVEKFKSTLTKTAPDKISEIHFFHNHPDKGPVNEHDIATILAITEKELPEFSGKISIYALFTMENKDYYFRLVINPGQGLDDFFIINR